ncbi:cytosolic sulfotransferase 5-like [Abrus precatorius]|uniref:Sulfotransferase n=1 Tax=Abrus precatorius TaxID=3816 RepID=A0A8B8KW10_ABRPR|nr:cytosolic sulfotransferase 5-like [Abrus precatorius]
MEGDNLSKEHKPKFLHDELPKELQEFLSTLPIEKGWPVPHYYQYQGVWYNPIILEATLTCQKHFQANDTDILLVSIPKAGTTWLKSLAFALLNRERYPNIQTHPLVTNNPHALVPFLELDLYSDQHFLPKLQALSSPRLLSTHLPYISLPTSVKESTCKIIYVSRNPKDTFISYWHFANKMVQKTKEPISLEEAFQLFCRGVSPYGPFCEHVLAYWKASLERPEKVLFLSFEDMKMRPTFYLKELAKFIECPFSEEEEAQGMVDDILKLCSFDNMRNLEANKVGKIPLGMESNTYFRRGQVGDWKNYLTVEMVEHLNTITEKKLGEHGIKFSDFTE